MKRIVVLLCLLSVLWPGTAQTFIRSLPTSTNLTSSTKVPVDDATYGTRAVTLNNLLSGAATNATLLAAITNVVEGTATALLGSKLDATNGTAVNLTVDGAKPTLYVTNVAAMRALTGLSDGQLVQTAGRTTPGYGGATFLWTTGLTTTTNLGTVFDLTAGGTGRFTLAHGDPGDIRLWGAIPGIGDDAPAIQAAVDSLTASTYGGQTKPRIFIPSGNWTIGSTITATNPIALIGEAVEATPATVTAYALNGSILDSTIADGSPVLSFTGEWNGVSAYAIQSIEIQNIGIDGSGLDGDGVWFNNPGSLADVRINRLIVRGVGGSGLRLGDGSKTNSPRPGYTELKNIRVYGALRDGIEISSAQIQTVAMDFENLYANSCGRWSFNFKGISFNGRGLVENNAAQLQSGGSLRLFNVTDSTLINCYFEGAGRATSAGLSLTPIFTGKGMSLEGAVNTTFIGCVVDSPAGDLTTAANAGLIHLTSSTTGNGFTTTDSQGNRFINTRLLAYASRVSAPTATSVGSGGSMGSGNYRYRVTFVYTNDTRGAWESPLAASSQATVRCVATDSVSLTSIPLGTTLGSGANTNAVIARKIYRTDSGGSTWKYLATVADNTTTTYTDTAAAGVSAADYQFHILASSIASPNEFHSTTVQTVPLVSDGSLDNRFNSIFESDANYNAQIWAGRGTFNGAYGVNDVASRRFVGADHNGLYLRTGRTANEIKHFEELNIAYDSAFPSGNRWVSYATDSTSTLNSLSIGGGVSSSYAATDITFYTAANNATTTGTARLTLSSSGQATFSGGITAQSTYAGSGSVTLDNATPYRIKDSGGTARNVANITSGNTVQFGNTSYVTRLYGDNTTGVIMGSPDGAGPSALSMGRVNVADAGNPLRNSRPFIFESSKYSGGAETVYNSNIYGSQDSTTPTASLYFTVMGTNRMRLKSDGTLLIGSVNRTLDGVEYYEVALSDETTAITTGTAKVTVRAPFALTVTAVRASLSTASTSGNPAIDINEGGVSIFSTTLTIDANEKTSTTAATAAVISDTAIADDAELTFDIDTAGTGAKGLKVRIYYTR